MEHKLKYASYGITCQEVPDEVSIVFNISGCNHHCTGCHSEYLWDYTGNYLLYDISSILDKYGDYVTCVCFMGGDQNLIELETACDVVKSRGLKTCIYSGLPDSQEMIDLFWFIRPDYLKLGEYNENLGGLQSRTTNQKFYKFSGDSMRYVDITNVFWGKYNDCKN